jgi:hypothetical protein
MLNRLIRIGTIAAVVASAGYLSTIKAQSVTGSIANGTITRGTAAKATVVFTLPEGLHANSNRPGNEYAVPTTVRISANGVKVGAVSYPRGRNRKFAFSENTLNVYEGRTAFGFTVTVPTAYRGSTIRLNVTVKYQACTNEVCYPPTSKQTTLTARVI